MSEAGEEVAVRVFETFTVDLHRLADWLQEKGIETVAMESTGVYWIPIYEILEERGLEVYLINARHIKEQSDEESPLTPTISPQNMEILRSR